MRPPPLRAKIDQALEQRWIAHVIKIDGLQDIHDSLVPRADFWALNPVPDLQLRNRNESKMAANRDVSAEVAGVGKIKHAQLAEIFRSSDETGSICDETDILKLGRANGNDTPQLRA